jgi:hypothetical protein
MIIGLPPVKIVNFVFESKCTVTQLRTHNKVNKNNNYIQFNLVYQ